LRSQRCGAVSVGLARRFGEKHFGVRRLAAAFSGAKLASRAVNCAQAILAEASLAAAKSVSELSRRRRRRDYLVNCRLVMAREITFS
jgi:hypothetical protein